MTAVGGRVCTHPQGVPPIGPKHLAFRSSISFRSNVIIWLYHLVRKFAYVPIDSFPAMNVCVVKWQISPLTRLLWVMRVEEEMENWRKNCFPTQLRAEEESHMCARVCVKARNISYKEITPDKKLKLTSCSLPFFGLIIRQHLWMHAPGCLFVCLAISFCARFNSLRWMSGVVGKLNNYYHIHGSN